MGTVSGGKNFARPRSPVTSVRKSRGKPLNWMSVCVCVVFDGIPKGGWLKGNSKENRSAIFWGILAHAPLVLVERDDRNPRAEGTTNAKGPDTDCIPLRFGHLVAATRSFLSKSQGLLHPWMDKLLHHQQTLWFQPWCHFVVRICEMDFVTIHSRMVPLAQPACQQGNTPTVRPKDQRNHEARRSCLEQP